VHFYAGCTKGTYIRTLGHDLATSLGSTGHLVALRREAIGEARVDKAWDVQVLVDKLFAAIRWV
jgi:tRNA pseudouridine55 synthase